MGPDPLAAGQRSSGHPPHPRHRDARPQQIHPARQHTHTQACRNLQRPPFFRKGSEAKRLVSC